MRSYAKLKLPSPSELDPDEPNDEPPEGFPPLIFDDGLLGLQADYECDGPEHGLLCGI